MHEDMRQGSIYRHAIFFLFIGHVCLFLSLLGNSRYLPKQCLTILSKNGIYLFLNIAGNSTLCPNATNILHISSLTVHQINVNLLK